MDTVYVIYLDNKMYENMSRKVAYLKIGSARQVVTVDSKKLAENMYNDYRSNNEGYKYWWNLNEEEQQKWLNKARSRFEIREFVERRE